MREYVLFLEFILGKLKNNYLVENLFSDEFIKKGDSFTDGSAFILVKGGEVIDGFEESLGGLSLFLEFLIWGKGARLEDRFESSGGEENR